MKGGSDARPVIPIYSRRLQSITPASEVVLHLRRERERDGEVSFADRERDGRREGREEGGGDPRWRPRQNRYYTQPELATSSTCRDSYIDLCNLCFSVPVCFISLRSSLTPCFRVGRSSSLLWVTICHSYHIQLLTVCVCVLTSPRPCRRLIRIGAWAIALKQITLELSDWKPFSRWHLGSLQFHCMSFRLFISFFVSSFIFGN